MGVTTPRLILGEHSANNLSGSGYGRSGVSSNSWDKAISARSQAARRVPFAGAIGYAWGGNSLNVSTEEMVHFDDTYASYALPANVGLTPPHVIVQAQSQTAPAGANITSSVLRAGNASLSYQWRSNGNPLPGATETSLTLTNIPAADGGPYSAYS